jgi:hypothetical protein
MALFSGFFKRKPKEPAERVFTEQRGIESSEDEHLLNALMRTVRHRLPLVPAMCLIAYENVFLVRTVFEHVAKITPACAPSLEDLARWLEQEHARFTSGSIEDEANSRRYLYFHTAVLLTIAHARAQQRPALWDGLADIWVALLPGAAALRKTLDTTILWSPSETAFFDDVKTERDGEHYCANHMMPPELRNHPKIWDWLWRDVPAEQRAELERSIEETMRLIK